MDETPKEPGTHEAMLERQRLRLSGKLNRPLRGIRGIKAIYTWMTRNKLKPKDLLTVKPPARWEESLEDRPEVLRKPPVTVIVPTSKGYGTPRKRWADRCATCNGSGEIVALRGGMRPCPRCQDA